MSTFSGLTTGLSSLYAQRRGLEVTGHNIANSNTEGYSRQRVRLEAEAGPVVPAMHYRYDGVGGGVAVADVQRLRDAFLESRAVQERGTEAGLRGGQVVLGRVEGILAEPSDSGIQSQLSDFWAGWDDVANNPTDLAARSQLLERAATLSGGLNGAVDRLEAQWSASYEQMSATVMDVNATAASVAEFNRAIQGAVNAGMQPNDLMDQRDLLVQRLGEVAGATVRQGEAGTVDVFLGTRALVSGRTADSLAVPPTGASMATPATPVGMSWSGGGAATVGGSVGGYLQGLNDVLPRYRDGIVDVATKLADSVNAQHVQGFDQSGTAGTDFFAQDATGRLSLALTAPEQVAASSSSGGGSGDAGGGNALALASLDTLAGGADKTYRALVVQLGVEAQTANRRVDIQRSILGQLDMARESEAGVNLDEEMINLLAYQRAYEGAARFITAVDQMLDTLINRTGLVGR